MRTVELVKRLKLELPYVHQSVISKLVSKLREDGIIVPLSGDKSNGFEWCGSIEYIKEVADIIDDYEDDLIDVQQYDARIYQLDKYVQPWRSGDPAVYEVSN